MKRRYPMEKNGKKERKNRQQLFSPANHHHHHHHHQQSLDRRRLVVLLPFQCATIIHWRGITKKEERKKTWVCVCLWAIDRRLGQPASLPAANYRWWDAPAALEKKVQEKKEKESPSAAAAVTARAFRDQFQCCCCLKFAFDFSLTRSLAHPPLVL